MVHACICIRVCVPVYACIFISTCIQTTHITPRQSSMPNLIWSLSCFILTLSQDETDVIELFAYAALLVPRRSCVGHYEYMYTYNKS